MKKRVFIVALISLLLLAVPAQATTRAIGALPLISFNGNTATCSVTIVSHSPKDKVVAEIELWQGENFVTSWEDSSTVTLWFEETAQVTSGKAYMLKVTYTINGGPEQFASASGTCK